MFCLPSFTMAYGNCSWERLPLYIPIHPSHRKTSVPPLIPLPSPCSSVPSPMNKLSDEGLLFLFETIRLQSLPLPYQYSRSDEARWSRRFFMSDYPLDKLTNNRSLPDFYFTPHWRATRQGVTSEVQRRFTNFFWECKFNVSPLLLFRVKMYHEAFIINVLLLLLHFSNIISQ